MTRPLILAAYLLAALIAVGTLEQRDAQAHKLTGQPAGIQLIHRADDARRGANGCRVRLEGARWPVERPTLDRRTRSLELRRWVVRRWERRAARACGELKRQLRYANSIRSRWIAVAEHLARTSAGDPWPNCPDPYDGTGSWDDTHRCEAGSYSWSACATSSMFIGPLQFHPQWRSLWRRFGIGC